uniref:Uncharacterized protein n=1 Tax=Anguilla anguilla TaxID=7936 RepID=A0A0E9UKD7_ANGAN
MIFVAPPRRQYYTVAPLTLFHLAAQCQPHSPP